VLKVAGRRGRLAWAGVFVLALICVAAGICTWWVARYAFAVHRLTRGVGDTVFVFADGRPWFRLAEERHDVRLAEIAPQLQDAVLAIEDRRFFYHPGIDPIGVLRALTRDVRSGQRREGGSTLTQQLARTLFLSNARTYVRKSKEAVIALLIETEMSKQQILELYLNRIYLSGGVYGVEAMSEHLYRKPASRLTLAEAALIAGLIRAPSTLSPWTNYDGALERSHVVLAAMRDQRLITPEQEAAARLVRPSIQPYRPPTDAHAGWAKDFLRQEFRNEFGGDHPPDWQVHTSFRPAVQDAAERAVAAGLQRLNRPDLQAALVALDPATGDILAMVGGADYRKSTYNRATRTRRQAGSAFKPFVYAAALSHGYSPVSVLRDLDRVTSPDDPEWHPRSVTHADNDALQSAMTPRVALAESNNAAAALLQQRVGTGEVRRVGSQAGLVDLPNVPSLALGTGTVSPLELTAAYTMFPGGGQVAQPRGLLQVFDANGSEVSSRPVRRTRVISEPVAFQMVSMLRDVVDRGTATAARSSGVRGPVGGKTGTTDDYRDAWFVGFSSSIVAGVWVGFDQPARIGRDAYAARIAVPIWADFMRRVAREFPAQEFAMPKGIRELQLCSVSHLKPVDGCPVYTEYFKDGDDVPSQLCPIHTGSFKQTAERAVMGVLRGIGQGIIGIFRRR
jgi:1A family penicillin-binding protein